MMSTAAERAHVIFKKRCKNFTRKINTYSMQLNTVTTKEAAWQIILLNAKEWDKIVVGFNELEEQYLEIQELKDLDAPYKDSFQLYADTNLKACMTFPESFGMFTDCPLDMETGTKIDNRLEIEVDEEEAGKLMERSSRTKRFSRTFGHHQTFELST